PGDEGSAVLGVPAGGGGNHPKPRYIEPVAQGAETCERGKRLLDRIAGEKSGGLDLATEPCEYLFVEDRRRASGKALIDHEANRIRADVDDRHRRPVIEATLGKLHLNPVEAAGKAAG